MNKSINKNILVFFTLIFPYDNGEEFIENEVVYISHYFEKVFLLPICVKNNSTVTRELPENYIVENVFKFYSVRIILELLINIFSKKSIKLYKELLINKFNLNVIFKNFKHYIFSLYKAIVIKSYLIPYISKDDNIYLYSFWLNNSITVMNILKELLPEYKIKMFSRAHRYDVLEKKEYINIQSIKKLDCIYCGSKYAKTEVLKFKCDNTTKVSVNHLAIIDNGINNYDYKKFNLVSCSALIPRKRVYLIAQAVKHIIDSNLIDNFTWTCIGDGEELTAFQNMFKEYNCVDFLGRLKHFEWINFLKNNTVSLFANTSDSEGMPVSIIEVISFGIPVIATNVGGNSEIVDDDCGILVENNISYIDLAEAIVKFSQLSNEQIFKFRNNARKKFKDYFDASIIYDSFYNTITNKEIV